MRKLLVLLVIGGAIALVKSAAPEVARYMKMRSM